MKILLMCSDFSYLSGSPLYVYTLAKELVQLGNEVTICSKLGGILPDKAREAGIEVTSTLSKDRTFDVMHLNQRFNTRFLDESYKMYNTPAVFTCHSEYMSQKPPKHARIKKYIVIRPSIAEKWGLKDAELIYNPIDFERFHPFKEKPKKDMTLFVGTIDTLRAPAARHLISSGKNCRFVGKEFDGGYINENVEWYNETWDIENHLKDATETAGILLGRSTLEGWACGLPGIIYDIDGTGEIKSVARHEVPEDMSPFDSKLVAKKILKIYHAVI